MNLLATPLMVQLEQDSLAVPREHIRVFANDKVDQLFALQKGKLRIGLVGGDHVFHAGRFQMHDQVANHGRRNVDRLLKVKIRLRRIALR